MIGLVQVGRQAMADRYAYLPFVGIFIMVCWGVAQVFEEKRLPAEAASSCERARHPGSVVSRVGTRSATGPTTSFSGRTRFR